MLKQDCVAGTAIRECKESMERGWPSKLYDLEDFDNDRVSVRVVDRQYFLVDEKGLGMFLCIEAGSKDLIAKFSCSCTSRILLKVCIEVPEQDPDAVLLQNENLFDQGDACTAPYGDSIV